MPKKPLRMLRWICCLAAVVPFFSLPASVQAIDMITDIKNLHDANSFDAVSIYTRGGGGPAALLGDTYTGSPLVQDMASAFFISDTAPTTHTFDGTGEDGGANLAGAVDNRFMVTESVSTVGLVQTVTVEWTSVDAAGAPTPWVDTGVTGPSGPFVNWRLDVGSVAGGSDPIDDPGSAYIDGSGQLAAFNSALAPLGTFGLSGLPADGSSSLFGVAVLGIGGQDIAGFDLASLQMSWQMTVPEPSAITMLGIGCVGFLGARRRSGRNRHTG